MSRRPRRPRREPSIAGQILVTQVFVLLLLIGASLALVAYDTRVDVRREATRQAVSVAQTVALSPSVQAAVTSDNPSATLQPFTERLRREQAADFVVIMDLDRVRYTHPDPAQIGRRFPGPVGDAPEGGIFTQEYNGVLGPTISATVPVRDDGGRVVALVGAGSYLDRIDQTVRADVAQVALGATAVLLGGLLASLVVSRRLRQATHGMGEREITRMYEYYRAVLGAVREGLLLLDERGRVQLANDEARRLLGLPDDVVGRSIEDLGLAPALVRAALGRTAESDEIYLAGDRILLVSSAPASWRGRELGAVVTLRDHTELRSATGQLKATRSLTDILRAQNHEAANRLHTVVSLIEMGRPAEAVEFATRELRVAQRLTDRVVDAVGDPVVTALLLGKSTEAAERGVHLTLTGSLPDEVGWLAPEDLVTVIGNLVDNAFEAVAGRPDRTVRVEMWGDDSGIGVAVEDSGPGLSQETASRVLERGWSTKATSAGGVGRGIGLALVGQVARRHHGTVRIGASDLGGARFEVTLAATESARPEVGSR